MPSFTCDEFSSLGCDCSGCCADYSAHASASGGASPRPAPAEHPAPEAESQADDNGKRADAVELPEEVEGAKRAVELVSHCAESLERCADEAGSRAHSLLRWLHDNSGRSCCVRWPPSSVGRGI